MAKAGVFSCARSEGDLPAAIGRAPEASAAAGASRAHARDTGDRYAAWAGPALAKFAVLPAGEGQGVGEAAEGLSREVQIVCH